VSFSTVNIELTDGGTDLVPITELGPDRARCIKGAQATALAVFMARSGASKGEIRHEIAHRFGYNLARTVAEVRPDYRWDVSCQGSVPEAIVAFLDSCDVENAIRLAMPLLLHVATKFKRVIEA